MGEGILSRAISLRRVVVPGPMGSYTVKKKNVGSKVSEFFWYTQDRQTFYYFYIRYIIFKNISKITKP